ncbi:hypothetical protein BGZ76_000135 [Entomortierella beljakovae]|nr:hypothetical protein BGZ76_000135 [Entomortierella beljakovae]
MAPLTNTRILKSRYTTDDESLDVTHFRTKTVELDVKLLDGEILVRNLYLGLDPYISLSFKSNSGGKIPSTDEPIVAFGVAEVIDSRNSSFPISSIVLGSNIHWEQYTHFSNPAASLRIIPNARNPDVALSAYVNGLGVNGLTAFAAWKTHVKANKGMTVYISSTAGPVGSMFAALAKRDGCFVIGSAGSHDKVKHLLEGGKVDAAFNYKTKNVANELRAAAPNGIDIYVDLVGGETLDIALGQMRLFGQILAVGNISNMNGKGAGGSYVMRNLGEIINKSLVVQGFGVFHHLDKFPQLWETIGPLFQSGDIKSHETVIEGVENAPEAFVDYMNSKYFGKVVIQVAEL